MADETTDGVGMIAAERRRQVEQEGWTVGHDDEHRDGELADAAACYAERAAVLVQGFYVPPGHFIPRVWPAWPLDWWKPSPDPIRNLVKAGALLAAEIDRLQACRRLRGRS